MEESFGSQSRHLLQCVMTSLSLRSSACSLLLVTFLSVLKEQKKFLIHFISRLAESLMFTANSELLSVATYQFIGSLTIALNRLTGYLPLSTRRKAEENKTTFSYLSHLKRADT